MEIKMSGNCFVGFDTSNYTTSAALCGEDGQITANLKIPLEVRNGEHGLRQSDAVFAHIKNLPRLTDMLGKAIRDSGCRVVGVGVSAYPRRAEGSYMPCFLCGISAAHSFAAGIGAKIYEFAHQDGHIMAAVYSSGAEERLFGGKFAAFHVSGGTTEVLVVTPRSCGFDIKLAGETADLNAGQVIDRVGTYLGIPFPCGAGLEALAGQYNGKIKRPRISVKNCVCNLSGLENMAAKLYSETQDKCAVAAFVFDYIERTLEEMCRQLMSVEGEMPVLFAGGVMSNRLMREGLLRSFEAYFAEPAFSSDNAAGTALLCRRRFMSENGGNELV